MSAQKRKPTLFDDTSEETRPRPNKKKPLRRKRGFRWMAWILLVLLTLGLSTGTLVIITRPDTYGLEFRGNLTLTAGAISRTESALAETARANAQNARDNAATVTALADRVGDVSAQETRIAQEQLGTQTALSVANAQNATRAAIDFANTQTVANQQATQIALDFQNTQVALNQNATQMALGFATQSASIPTPITPTITPLPSPTPDLRDGFVGGISGDRWRFASAGDFGFGAGGGVIATRDGAWLITQQSDYSTYTIAMNLQPSLPNSNYVLVLNIGANGDNLAVRLAYDGVQIARVGLYRFTIDQFLEGTGLLGRELSQVASIATTIPIIRPSIAVSVNITETQIQIAIENTVQLTHPLAQPMSPGAVGIQIPQGAMIETIVLMR